VFAAYPNLRIVHHAGHVHSNVDPISRLRRPVPIQTGPEDEDIKSLTIKESINDPLHNMYEEIAPKFEQQVLQIMSQCLNIQTNSAFSYQTFETLVETHTHLEDVVIPQHLFESLQHTSWNG